jgi:uncharacterized RDD family membrane protein YckC
MESIDPRGFSDQLNIATPEQVELSFPIAGVGSRFVAILLDSLIQFGTILLLVLLFALIATIFPGSAGHKSGNSEMSISDKWVIAILILIGFTLYTGYYILFEAFWHGQTPGKRVMKLRVIKDSGRQITFFESLARNTIRIVDSLPSMYLVGVLSMLCTRANKRLGDLAAGTVVVHERSDDQPMLHVSQTTLLTPQALDLKPWASTPAASAAIPADAIRRLTAQDLIVIEAFFARALDLTLEVRASIADRIASQMAARMGVAVPAGNPERFLESLAFAMRSSARL